MKCDRATYTINKTILDNFNVRANELSINKSALIENFIRQWLNANEVKPVKINQFGDGYLEVREGRLFVNNREEQ